VFGFTNFSHNWLKFLPDQNTLAMGNRLGALMNPEVSFEWRVNANTNLWADGYASFGLVDVIVIILWFAMLLRLMDRVVASRDHEFSHTALAVVGTVFVNGYLHTSLLSSGVLLSVFSIWVSPQTISASSNSQIESNNRIWHDIKGAITPRSRRNTQDQHSELHENHSSGG